MDQKELKQLLARVGLAALIAGAAAVGCAHADKSADGGGASSCGGKGGFGGSKK